ncbi:TPA: hypothetical protein ACTXXA_003655 [Legionella anisa]
MDRISPADRARLARGELSKLGGHLFHSPDIKIRWLNYQLKLLESETSEAITQQAYAALSLSCEDSLGDFVSIQKKKIQDIDESYIKKAKELFPGVGELESKEKARSLYLKDQIKELHDELFSQCLTQATREYLRTYNPDAPFSAEDIIRDAMIYYKEQMYKEALIEFEAVSLVACYTRLDSAGTLYKYEKKLVLDTLDMELRFLLDSYVLMCKRGGDLTKFKTDKFKDFYEAIDFSEGINTKQMEQFIEKNSESPADDTLTRVLSMHYRRNTYHFTAHMAPVLEHQNRLSALSPSPNSLETPVVTQDKNIQKLRQIAQKYAIFLNERIKKEATIYKKRDTGAALKRKHALDTIILFANQSEEFSPAVQEIMKSAYKEIQKNVPSWLERKFHNQLWDLIKAGPVCRFFSSVFGKHAQAELNMVNAVKGNLPKEENDAERNGGYGFKHGTH